MSAIERVVRDLPGVGFDVMDRGLGFESTSWNFHSSPQDVEGRVLCRSRLGDEATAPNVAFDGVADIDADRPASQ